MTTNAADLDFRTLPPGSHRSRLAHLREPDFRQDVAASYWDMYGHKVSSSVHMIPERDVVLMSDSDQQAIRKARGLNPSLSWPDTDPAAVAVAVSLPERLVCYSVLGSSNTLGMTLRYAPITKREELLIQGNDPDSSVGDVQDDPLTRWTVTLEGKDCLVRVDVIRRDSEPYVSCYDMAASRAMRAAAMNAVQEL